VALLPRKHPESLQPFIRDPIIVCALSESRHAVFYERGHGQASRLRHMLHLESPHRNPTRDLRNEWLENNRRRSLCLPSEGRCKAEPDLRNSLIAEAEAATAPTALPTPSTPTLTRTTRTKSTPTSSAQESPTAPMPQPRGRVVPQLTVGSQQEYDALTCVGGIGKVPNECVSRPAHQECGSRSGGRANPLEGARAHPTSPFKVRRRWP
jgi:hypothetical protein